MDHFVKVNKLPDGLEIPPDLKDRIYFDADTHKLVCRGYMSKADFDRMSQITNDWKFRRTLEELFRLCTPEDPPKAGGVRRVISAVKRLFSVG